MGNGPRGLQRGRRRLELLHPRSRALARLPLGGGRPRGHLGRPPAPLLRAGAVEREGCHPEGAGLRPLEQRGQPRRGSEGVLLLPRQHPDALVHEVPLQVPAGRLSVRRPRQDERPADAGGDGVRAPRHRRLRGGSVLRRLRGVRQGESRGRPREDHRGEPGTGSGRAPPPADALVPERLVVLDRGPCGEAESRAGRGARGRERRLRVPSPARGLHAPLRRRRPVAVHGERDQQRAALPREQEREPLRQGRDQRLRGPGQARQGEPGEGGHQGRGALPCDDRSGRFHDGAAPPHGLEARLRGIPSATSIGSSPRGSRRPTTSTAR